MSKLSEPCFTLPIRLPTTIVYKETIPSLPPTNNRRLGGDIAAQMPVLALKWEAKWWCFNYFAPRFSNKINLRARKKLLHSVKANKQKKCQAKNNKKFYNCRYLYYENTV